MFLHLNDIKTEYVVSSACNFIQRASGLIFRKQLLTNEVFHIKPCNSVHTFGMKYAIDIVYLDKTGVILKIIKNMQRRRINWCFKAHSVLEFNSNTSDLLAMQIGDVISF
jgi:uncharacterized membrane protein (UPF0127 family)